MAHKFKIRFILLAGSISAILFVLGISSALFYTTASDLLNSIIRQSERDGVMQIYENIQKETDQLRRFLETVESDSEITAMTQKLLNGYSDLTDSPLVRAELDNFSKLLTLRMHIFSSIQNIIVVTDEFSVAVNRSWKLADDLYSNSPFADMLAESDEVIRIEAPAALYLSELAYSPVAINDAKTVYVKKFVTLSDIPGAVVFVMSTNWLKSAVGNDKNVVVYTDDGVCLYAVNDRAKLMYEALCHDRNTSSAFFLDSYEGINYGVTTYRTNGYHIAYFSDTTDYYKHVNEIRLSVILSVLVITAASIIILGWYSRRMFRDYISLIENATGYVPGKTLTKRIRKHKLTFKTALILYFLLILALPAIVFQVNAYLRLPKLINTSIDQRNLKVIEKQVFDIENLSALNLSAFYSLALSQDVQDALQEKFSVTGNNVLLRNANTFNNVFDTNIYSLDGKLQLYTSYYSINDQFSPELESYKPFSRGIWVINGKNKLNRPVISYSGVIMKIVDGEYTLTPAGFTELVYQTQVLDHVLDSLSLIGLDGYFLDEHNQVIYSHSTNQSGSTLPNGQMLVFESKSLPLRLAANRRTDYSHEIFALSFKSGFPMLLIVFGLIILLSWLASNVINKSVSKIIGQIERIGNGEIALAHESAVYELDRIFQAFSSMSQRIDDLIKNEYTLKLREEVLKSEKSDAELAALQAQINPHFLYNTLESVKWLIRKDEAEHAETVITALGSLFRYAISIKQPVTTVEKELEAAWNYITIQHIRVEKPINYTIKAPEETLKASIVRMTLQPLLENAIQHGIMKKRDAGRIEVVIEKVNDLLVIHIMDDGAGFSMEQIEAFNNYTDNESSATERHVGIYNVHRRIRLYFGESYGLHISKNDLGLTVVSIIQPYIQFIDDSLV